MKIYFATKKNNNIGMFRLNKKSVLDGFIGDSYSDVMLYLEQVDLINKETFICEADIEEKEVRSILIDFLNDGNCDARVMVTKKINSFDFVLYS